MLFKSRNILLISALLLALALALVIAAKFNPETQLERVVKALPQGIDVALQDIDYTHVENGVPRWRLVARQVEHDSSSRFLSVNAPQLTFFSDQGESQGALTAETAQLSQDYQVVELSGQVVLENVSGYTLYTEALTYDHRASEARTDAPVRMVSEQLEVQGQGLLFDLEKRQLSLLSQVSGRLSP
ncbi:MAG: LPS export ABC transporter periplasmic protein LptC [Desulfuromonadales bacterium]|nr:LPS export ABC transporter periplasmic protein LptC [Desulfuromonadales bacterium]